MRIGRESDSSQSPASGETNARASSIRMGIRDPPPRYASSAKPRETVSMTRRQASGSDAA